MTLVELMQETLSSDGRDVARMRAQNKSPVILGRSPSGQEQLVALLEITRSLTAEMDLDRLFWLIVDTTSHLLGAERTTIYLVDEKTNELWSAVAQGPELKEIRMTIGEGLAGYVALTGEVLNIGDAYHSPYFNAEVDRVTGYRTGSILTMPMWNRRQRIIGVIQVINKVTGVFTKEDEHLLESLASSAAVALENSLLHAELKVMFDSLISTLSATIDARDPQTSGHSQRVTAYALLLGQALGLPLERMEVLRIAAQLHDIGKIGVPEGILTKPGRLTDTEREIMQLHAQYTKDILSKIHFTPDMTDVPYIAGQHHERLDGSGYPHGMLAPDLPVESRILAVADVFEALTHDRYYRKAFARDDAFAWIVKQRGILFDADVVDALGQVMSDEQFLALDEVPDLLLYQVNGTSKLGADMSCDPVLGPG